MEKKGARGEEHRKKRRATEEEERRNGGGREETCPSGETEEHGVQSEPTS